MGCLNFLFFTLGIRRPTALERWRHTRPIQPYQFRPRVLVLNWPMAGDLRRHGTVAPNMLPSPEARPHGLLKSNRSRSAAGSVGEGVVTFAATDLGAPALGAGIVSRAAWFDVTPRSRLRLYCPVPLRAKIAKLLKEALPFHSIKKRD